MNHILKLYVHISWDDGSEGCGGGLMSFHTLYIMKYWNCCTVGVGIAVKLIKKLDVIAPICGFNNYILYRVGHDLSPPGTKISYCKYFRSIMKSFIVVFLLIAIAVSQPGKVYSYRYTHFYLREALTFLKRLILNVFKKIFSLLKI